MVESDEIRAALEREIEEARNLERKPDNEACTCEWVIVPLLWAAGYAKHEIISQDAASGHGIPDYTILPNTDWTWFLEAKTWSRNIDNGDDAVQALNYANAQGLRWVVLSNGRQWMLFDNNIRGVEAPKRLVATAEIAADDFIDFMLALSKPSVTAGKLADYVIRSRVRLILDRELCDKDSAVIKAITSKLRQLGIDGVQCSHVVEYFRPPETRPEDEAPGEPTPEPRPVEPRKEYTLAELWDARERLFYTKPAKVTFPDRTSAEIGHWAFLATELVKWFAERNRLPSIPFRGLGPGGKNWFLNYRSVHENEKPMKAPKEVPFGERTIYVDTNRSAANMVECLYNLCNAVGEPPEGFVVTLAKPLASE